MPDATDPLALAARSGLPDDLLYLRHGLPRDRWTALNQTAAFWMQMHDSFRRQQTDMAATIAAFRQNADTAGFHRRIIPTLQGFLQHLDGHHRIESGHYFPQFRRIEPRIQNGLDLLDRDHDAIHTQLEAMFQAALALHQAVQSAAPATDLAHRLADTITGSQIPMLRHLEDEEDIVIPLIQRHGDMH